MQDRSSSNPLLDFSFAPASMLPPSTSNFSQPHPGLYAQNFADVSFQQPQLFYQQHANPIPDTSFSNPNLYPPVELMHSHQNNHEQLERSDEQDDGEISPSQFLKYPKSSLELEI
jgi:hypothetical protein